MIEEGFPRRSELNAPGASDQQVHSHLRLKITDLTAKGGLRRKQPSFGRCRKTARLSDRNEVAKMPKFQSD
jgi:hypothetical protein